MHGRQALWMRMKTGREIGTTLRTKTKTKTMRTKTERKTRMTIKNGAKFGTGSHFPGFRCKGSHPNNKDSKHLSTEIVDTKV